MIALLAMAYASLQSDLKTLEVGGLDRTAIVVAPTKKTAHPPVVFGFHGHGGTARFAYRKFDIHTLWPEAVVVYPQGLATKTSRDPQGLRAGWQNIAGLNGDRDLKLFDALLSDVSKQFEIDPKRVYAMGHSNGAMFTYLLWQMRPEKLAAVSPVAGVFRPRLGLEPLPCLVAGGTKDTIVPWDRQEAGIKSMAEFLGVKEEVSTKPSASLQNYKGSKGRMSVFIHSGAHEYPEVASRQMVDFFKRHQKSAKN
jgi:polyhydroxybutyrate depolymerase